MKKISIIAVGLVYLFCGMIVFAQTTGWFEERTLMTANGAIPRIDGLVNHGFTEKIGAFVWFQAQKDYSEAYGGVTYSPKPWLQFAVGPGLEQAHHQGRVGGYVWLGNERGSVLLVSEDGGSGPWWKIEGNYKATKLVGVGFLSERFRGSGPRLELAIPHTPLTIWGAPLLSRNAVKALIGIRVKF